MPSQGPLVPHTCRLIALCSSNATKSQKHQLSAEIFAEDNAQYDRFYITLHQVIGSFEKNPTSKNNITNISTTDFEALLEFLKPIFSIYWFHNLPDVSKLDENQVDNVYEFLSRLSWALNGDTTRDIKPLITAYQSSFQIHCDSPLLQEFMFLRTLSPTESIPSLKMEKLMGVFSNDQKETSNLVKRLDTISDESAGQYKMILSGSTVASIDLSTPDGLIRRVWPPWLSQEQQQRLSSNVDQWYDSLCSHIQKGAIRGDRYHFLLNACRNQDPFSIYSHQLLCLWDLDCNRVYNNLPQPIKTSMSKEDIDTHLYVLKRYFGTPDGKLLWYSEFPLESERFFEMLKIDGTNFLNDLFEALKELNALFWEVKARNYPMTAVELTWKIRLVSFPTLQAELFRLSVTYIDSFPEETMCRLQAIFCTKQHEMVCWWNDYLTTYNKFGHQYNDVLAGLT